MSIVVVGGDRIKRIEKKLYEKGFQEINHITGRKKNDIKQVIVENTDYVLVLTDYIGHTLSKNIKKKSKEQEVKVIFARRSWSSIEESLDGIDIN